MQESNSAAQNKLGELYVEFGSKGLGGLLGGLNGVQAQFLLTKNAAEQAIKPIWGMSKKVSGSIVEFNKLNFVTGLSVSHLMNMEKWAKLNSIDFSEYIGNLKNLQKAMGEALINRNPQVLQGFAMLGISPDQLDYKNPEKVFSLITKNVKNLDPVMRSVALGLVGLSDEMVYAMSKANKKLDASQKLTKYQQRNINEVNNATQELGVTWETVGQKIIGNWENLDGIILGVSNKLKGLIDFIDGNSEKKINIIANFITDVKDNIKHFFKGFRADGKGATELALTGNDKAKEKLNFIGKLGYYGTRSGMYTGLGFDRSFGGKTTMNDIESTFKTKFDKLNGTRPTPQTLKQGNSVPSQNINQVGDRKAEINIENNITVNSNGNQLDSNAEQSLRDFANTVNGIVTKNMAYNNLWTGDVTYTGYIGNNT